MGLTYRQSGVDYEAMDPFKRRCQQKAIKTAGNLNQFNLQEITASRGESAYLIEFPDFLLAHVQEGLGTKNLVADAMQQLTGKVYYDRVAQCTVAMIVNDIITLGALPISIAMHLAVGDSDWFKDEKRSQSLIDGWRTACDLAGAAWAGGETPTLKDIVYSQTAELSGSAIGLIKPKTNLIDPAKITDGDRIILLASSGIHANGLTLARQIAKSHPQGYLAQLFDGTSYGQALLAPTVIYVKAIKALQEAGIKIHYTVNITGHGWRKLMRAPEPFVYVVKRIPKLHPVFEFIQKYGPVSNKEAYGNLNMGAGFAIYVAEEDVNQTLEVLSIAGYQAWNGGYIEKRGDKKKVIIKSKGLTFDAKTLQVR